MEVALNEPAAVRIIGNLMGNYINAKAVIRGTITKIEPDGKKGTMKTTDEEFIQLLFEKQGNNAIPGSLIEAVGQVMSRNQFRVVNLYSFQLKRLLT
ncbi:hypothetical protein TYRP_019305 [Tyrophagus putrescentiae]|nr:hypothetical protein TYRP_019305 [Tyrophagus putrescentiae]